MNYVLNGARWMLPFVWNLHYYQMDWISQSHYQTSGWHKIPYVNDKSDLRAQRYAALTPPRAFKNECSTQKVWKTQNARKNSIAAWQGRFQSYSEADSYLSSSSTQKELILFSALVVTWHDTDLEVNFETLRNCILMSRVNLVDHSLSSNGFTYLLYVLGQG